MSKYLQKYEQFIEVFERLFHIKLSDPIEEVFNSIQSILISKYKLHKSDLIFSLIQAIQFNYRSIQSYIKIINLILSELSLSGSDIKIIIDDAEAFNLSIDKTTDGIYQISPYKFFPTEDDLHYIIMYDQIDKFKEYAAQQSLEDIELYSVYFRFSPIEASCYYGSVNIFNFIRSNLKQEITQSCLEYSFIGGNTDIINECLNSKK